MAKETIELDRFVTLFKCNCSSVISEHYATNRRVESRAQTNYYFYNTSANCKGSLVLRTVATHLQIKEVIFI